VNFIELMGLLFFVIIGFIVGALLRKLILLAIRRCADNCLTRRLRRKVDYALVITRFLLEGCLEIGLCAGIAIFSMSQESFSNFSDCFALICAFLSVLCLLAAPIYQVWMRRKYLQDVKEDRKESPNGVMFVEYKLEAAALWYPTIFFLRRYCMIIVIVVMPGLKYA